MLTLDSRTMRQLPIVKRIERIMAESPDLFEALAHDNDTLIKAD